MTEDARFRERSSIHQGALTNCDFQLNLSRNQILTVLSLAVLAADPGLPQTEGVAGRPSDRKKGSVLFYNLYSSRATAPATQNSRISITNTNDQASAFIHLYFVDGSSCSVADNFICLTANQTASFWPRTLTPE